MNNDNRKLMPEKRREVGLGTTRRGQSPQRGKQNPGVRHGRRGQAPRGRRRTGRRRARGRGECAQHGGRPAVGPGEGDFQSPRARLRARLRPRLRPRPGPARSCPGAASRARGKGPARRPTLASRAACGGRCGPAAGGALGPATPTVRGRLRGTPTRSAAGLETPCAGWAGQGPGARPGLPRDRRCARPTTTRRRDPRSPTEGARGT